MLTRKTAAEIAGILQAVAHGHHVSGLGFLVGVTAQWSAARPELGEVQREFARASRVWLTRIPRRSHTEHMELTAAAGHLADALAAYGDERLTREDPR